jgi:hypothetical protein
LVVAVEHYDPREDDEIETARRQAYRSDQSVCGVQHRQSSLDSIQDVEGVTGPEGKGARVAILTRTLTCAPNLGEKHAHRIIDPRRLDAVSKAT